MLYPLSYGRLKSTRLFYGRLPFKPARNSEGVSTRIRIATRKENGADCP